MKKIKIDIARIPLKKIECDERHSIFAPSYDLLMKYKDGHISWDEYVDVYKQEMRDAFKYDPDAFYVMADRFKAGEVDFYCWCNLRKIKDKKCHRFIIQEIFMLLP